MKITFNINLANRQFVIDDDAYKMLQEYLNAISNAYASSPDKIEIVNDIETRICELFIEKKPSNGCIITIEDVHDVIERIGRPQDFIEEENIADNENVNPETNSCNHQCPPPPPLPKSKKLFRAPYDKMLGGVCGGIAAYLNIDVTWIRLLFVLTAFMSFSSIFIVYIVMWIVIPEAKTPYDQLRMRGVTPTAKNIAESVTNMYSQNKQTIQNGTQKFFSIVSNIVLIAIASISSIVVISLITAFIVLLFCIIFYYQTGEKLLPELHYNDSWLLLVTSFTLLISFIIPLIMAIINIFHHKIKPISSTIKNSIAITWIISILISVAGCIVIYNRIPLNLNKYILINKKIEQYYDTYENDTPAETEQSNDSNNSITITP